VLTVYLRRMELKRKYPAHASPEAAVSLERLERAMVLSAHIVVRYGPRYAPYFERLEREVAVARAAAADANGAAERARRLLAVRGELDGLSSAP
jgi:hypothetical protein